MNQLGSLRSFNKQYMEMKIIEVALTFLISLTLRTMAADCQCQHLNRVGEGMKLTVQNTPLHVGDKVCMCCYTMNKSQSQSAAVTFIRNNTPICEVGEGNQQYICKVLTDGIHVLTIEKATEVDQGEWRCETRYNQSNFVSIEVLNATNPISSTSNTPSVFSTTKTTQNNPISKPEPVIYLSYWITGVAAIIFISVVVGVYVMCCNSRSLNNHTDRSTMDMLSIERNVMTMVAALNVHSAITTVLDSSSSTHQRQDPEPLGWVRSLSSEAGLCKRGRPSISSVSAVVVPIDDKKEAESEEGNYYEPFNNQTVSIV